MHCIKFCMGATGFRSACRPCPVLDHNTATKNEHNVVPKDIANMHVMCLCSDFLLIQLYRFNCNHFATLPTPFKMKRNNVEMILNGPITPPVSVSHGMGAVPFSQGRSHRYGWYSFHRTTFHTRAVMTSKVRGHALSAQYI